MARKKAAIPRWILWTPILLAPLVLLNLCVAFFGNSLVFPARRLGRHLMPIRITCSRTRWS
jgi:hypothetical protein